jgi:SSS family solute:Na+ symporter
VTFSLTPTLAATHLATLDLVIVALYLVAMVGIGVYYSFTTNDSEDYLLGGRRMASTTVGMSLFASMLSTISFIAWPGEIIRHGPTIAAQIVAYPVVFLLVGWLLIPKIMSQRVTSAYELLEAQLGRTTRYLASIMFVMLRTLWMAVVVFATIDKVIVPVFGLLPSSTPLLCAGLGIVTVFYSVLGGLRAVVLTDVIQTLILLMGAAVSLAIIMWNLGGIRYVIPDGWPEHWSNPQIGFHLSERSVLGFLLNFCCWYVATMGSDQMAIQRFVATPDTRSARQVLRTSLSIDAMVFCLMACVGLSLMSWFVAHPNWLASGETIEQQADRLFPLFIVRGLPVGLTGMVIAGLMAAAMSSLSSGINSTAAVITTDWLQGMCGMNLSTRGQLWAARLVSAAMGIIVVAMAVMMQFVETNLYELTVRVAGLMTGPLFVLFFMAMFVPRATTASAMLAAFAAVAIAGAISFADAFQLPMVRRLGFLWILPLSMATGAVVGVVSSYAIRRGDSS